ncbi:TetR family transcriptional regulator [Mycobacterium celatum]|uniref:TetR family transcriptional regulator n=1 Tax=Mycobacterium celatum TaxID=28045 RepID=A0A1X1RUJ4_MYCCE|nr:TetR family transcriptional regulator [Mycobacterium celatum]ORV18078.1 TetR family transcriptional regulator [Mycobacterium celatum]PIB80486.1 TetR/AcrR family transcriptional regulator [Mycobacterium celatum]
MTSAALSSDESARQRDRVLDVVVDILETDGYDAVQLREVARRARTSLATIYKRYATRDELILAALDCWMDENRYAGLTAQTHDSDESLYAGLMRVLRTIFEPWERHPAMLEAYFRARTSPGGERLIRRGFDAVLPVAMAVLADVDSEFVHDLDTVVSSLVYGLVGRFAAGEIEVTEIVPAIDRAVFRLTAGYEASRPKS